MGHAMAAPPRALGGCGTLDLLRSQVSCISASKSIGGRGLFRYRLLHRATLLRLAGGGGGGRRHTFLLARDSRLLHLGFEHLLQGEGTV